MSDFLSYSNACSLTTRSLKYEKRNSWKHFCSNLKPSYTIQHLWSTARRFKNCVIPSIRPDNDDRFESFRFKIAPCYVLNKVESSPSYTRL